jgi:ribosomal protein S18 acetylase RimI-like enzyme
MPPFKIKIRTATKKDRFAIQKLNELSLPVVYDLDRWEVLIGNKTDHFKKDSYVTYVLTKSEDIIAYCACDGTGCIVSFAVAEKQRGQKYGYKLLVAAIDDLRKRGHTKMQLRVKLSNEIAKKLYTSVGFQVIELLKDYYKAGFDGDQDEDAYLMELNISK